MDVQTAASLIQSAVVPGAATWADLGAGTGTFTLALASLLGENGRIIALDRDASALAELRRAVRDSGLEKRVVLQRADLLQPLNLPPLDGVLLANALHFVHTRDQRSILSHIVALLRPFGRLLVVDYDGRAANQWVPFPISSGRLAEILTELGVAAPTVVGSIPSRYGGNIYAALALTSAAPR